MPLTKEETFLVSSILFTAIALGHGLRLAGGWDLILGVWSVPMWLSGAIFLVAAYLAYKMWAIVES